MIYFYGRGAARAEDAQGIHTQSHISPSILVYEQKQYAPSVNSHLDELLPRSLERRDLLGNPQPSTLPLQFPQLWLILGN